MKYSQRTLLALSWIYLLPACLGSCNQDRAKSQSQDRVQNQVKSQSQGLGVLPWMKNNCYLNASIQLIAKFFPHIFDNSDDRFAKAVKAVLPKIREDKGNATKEEALEIYEAFWEKFPKFGKKGVFNVLALEEIMKEYRSPKYSGITKLKVLCSDSSESDEEISTTTFNSKPPLFKKSFIETLRQQPVEIKPNMVFVLENTLITIWDDNLQTLTQQLNAFKEPLFQIALTEEERKGSNMASSYELVGFITRQSRNAHFVAYTKLDGTWRRYNDLEGTTGPISEAEVLTAVEESVYYFYKVLP